MEYFTYLLQEKNLSTDGEESQSEDEDKIS